MSSDSSLLNEELHQEQIQLLMAQKLQDAGAVDNLKLVLRQDIIKLLHEKPMEPAQRINNFGKFWSKVVLCFIANYLKTQKYEHTLAMFLPESHLQVGDLIGTQDLCSLVGLNIRKYEDFLPQISKDGISALEVLIKLTQMEQTLERQDHSSQTEDTPPTYEQRMNTIQDEYLKRMDYFKLTNASTLEEKLAAVRKQCEQKYQAQFQVEIERIKRNLLAEVQLEERNRLGNTVVKERERLEQDYQKRLSELKEKEQHVLVRLQARMQDIERDHMQQREKLVKELDHLEMEKIRFHRHKCEDTKVVQDELDALENLKKELRDQLAECYKERAELRDKLKAQLEAPISRGKENVTYQGKVDEIKLFDHQKEQIKQLENHQAYLSQENQTLHKEVLQLQKERSDLQAEINRHQNTVSQLKDENIVEIDHTARLNKRIAALEQEAQQNQQLIKDLEVKLEMVREEQLNQHRKHQADLHQHHTKMLDLEREYTNRVNSDMQGFMAERADLVQGQYELEKRIEELMLERDELRRTIRDRGWEQKMH